MSELPMRGLIDMHSHMLPGVDDGCTDVGESIECVKQIKRAGFEGTICTPHAGGFTMPMTAELVEQWVSDLQIELKKAGIKYELWPGAEHSLTPQSIDWFKDYGVITLAGTNRVLADVWMERWEKWLEKDFEWLLGEGYQPILAHPERIPCGEKLNKGLMRLEAMGVWLQGNYQCITGEAGYMADVLVRQLLHEDRYRMMGLDMHRPNTLRGRLDGLQMVEVECGRERVERLTGTGLRKAIWGEKL